MTSPSYFSLLRREIHAVRDMLGRLKEDGSDDELLRAARERLGVAIQYAGEVNRRYTSSLEDARRALWTASRSRSPKPRVRHARAIVAAILENVGQDVTD